MTLDEPRDFLDQSLEGDKLVVFSTQYHCPLHRPNQACHRLSSNFKIRQAFVSGRAALIREQMGK
jgi:hypothetical protein